MKIQTLKAIKPIYKITIMLTMITAAALPLDVFGQGVQPYRFERVNEHNFSSQGWREQEVLSPPGLPQVFLDESENIKIVCGPENDSDHRLIKGSVTMNLPTTAFPTLRRIRLRRAGYSGTYLAYLTELKYSTYLVHGGTTVMVLQVDANGDGTRDFNIAFAPELQGDDYPAVELDTWQQWDALHGLWNIEVAAIPNVPKEATIDELVALYPTAQIIDTPPVGHNGEGVRFTVGGGSNPSLYFNNVSYFDDLIIGTADRQRSTLFDFTCDSSE